MAGPGALFPVALAISLYTVAVTMSRATALVAAALTVAAEIPATGQGGWHNSWLAMIYEVIAIAAIVVAGLYTSTRRAYLAELRDRAERLEREHDQASALATAVERARIARDMHDSVAHHLTVIVALSDGALAAVTRAPARPRTPSGACPVPPGRRWPRPAACSASCGPRAGWNSGNRSRACPTSTACSPGSGRRGCRSGMNAAARPRDTPPGVQLVIFRLIQEALTNTMKHAGPSANAAVRLRLEPGEIRVEVEDDGAGSAGVPRAPGGGLTGMAERVGAYGGELTCGPRQPRGWRVTARLDPGTAVPP